MIYLFRYWKPLAVIAILVAFWCWGFYARGVVEQASKAKELQAQQEQQARVEKLAFNAGVEHGKRENKTRVVTREIAKEVVRYVQVHPDRLVLPDAWRLLHDSAATNTATVAKSVGSAGPTDDAAAIVTVTGNYAECQRWRDQVIGWQEWYAAIHTK